MKGFPGRRGEGGWVLREISRPLSIIFVVAGAAPPWWWVVAEVVVAVLTRCDYTRAPAVSRVFAGRTHSVSPPIYVYPANIYCHMTISRSHPLNRSPGVLCAKLDGFRFFLVWQESCYISTSIASLELIQLLNCREMQ